MRHMVRFFHGSLARRWRTDMQVFCDFPVWKAGDWIQLPQVNCCFFSVSTRSFFHRLRQVLLNCIFSNLQSPPICSRNRPWCRRWPPYPRLEPAASRRSPAGTAAAVAVKALPGPGCCVQPPGRAPSEAAWRWACAWSAAWTGNGVTRMTAKATWAPWWRSGGKAAQRHQIRLWWCSGTAAHEPTTVPATRAPTTCCFMIMPRLVRTHDLSLIWKHKYDFLSSCGILHFKKVLIVFIELFSVYFPIEIWVNATILPPGPKLLLKEGDSAKCFLLAYVISLWGRIFYCRASHFLSSTLVMFLAHALFTELVVRVKDTIRNLSISHLFWSHTHLCWMETFLCFRNFI